jgi:hypothetical protein
LLQVNAAMLMKNLPPHLRNMIVKSGRAMPVHAAAAAAAQAGKQPAVGSPKVVACLCKMCLLALYHRTGSALHLLTEG